MPPNKIIRIPANLFSYTADGSMLRSLQIFEPEMRRKSHFATLSRREKAFVWSQVFCHLSLMAPTELISRKYQV